MPISISVIIPTFNRPTKLARALSSCAIQTRSPYEILIVDNGDNHETKAIVDTAIEKYNFKIRYLRSEKFAHRAALKTGIEAATGEWLTILDDDDFLVPDRIENDAISLEGIGNSVNLLVHDFIRIDYRNSQIWQHTMANKTLGLFEALTIDGFPPQAAVTFRTRSIQAHHSFHLKDGWMTEFDLYANMRPHGDLIRSGKVGYIMDDTRTAGRVTGSDISKHIQAVELHRERFLETRHYLHDDQKEQVDPRLDQQQAFFCAKVLSYKAFFGDTAHFCRAHPKESIKGILAPLRSLASRYFSSILPEMRGSKTYTLKQYKKSNPSLSEYIVASKL